MSLDYAIVKTVHQAVAAVSFIGFFARGAGSLAGAEWVRGRAARSLPHVVDTVLLLSALTLAWLARLDPFAASWLLAKIVALLLYVVLGVVALRQESSRLVRGAAWVSALVVFGYIVSVAVTKDPAGFLAAILTAG